jgi:O-antigen/teichoic acid export membrane protein
LIFPGNALVGLGRVNARLVAYCTSGTFGLVIYILLIPTLSWKGAVIGSYACDALLVIILWAMLLRTKTPAVSPQPDLEPALEYELELTKEWEK